MSESLMCAYSSIVSKKSAVLLRLKKYYKRSFKDDGKIRNNYKFSIK